jgi:hypothetical protein
MVAVTVTITLSEDLKIILLIYYSEIRSSESVIVTVLHADWTHVVLMEYAIICIHHEGET